MLADIHPGPRGARGRGSVLNSASSRRGAWRRSALLLALGLASGHVLAQGETLVVTGSREPLTRHQLAADVVVIDAERIRASAADSLEDLLRREAGVQVLRNGAPGQNAGIMMRGASSGQTLLLVDGVRVGAATLGAPEFDLISLADVERVEILRGPASSLYGADAIGGVVQVFTRRGRGAPHVGVRLAAGGYGAREASATGDARVEAIDLAAGLNHERARGLSANRPNDLFGNHNPDADGFSRRSASLQAGWSPAPQQRLGLVVRETRLNAQYDGAEFLPPTFAQDASGDFRSHALMRQVAVDGRSAVGQAWTVSARLARDESERSSGAHAPDTFGATRRQGTLQASWRLQREQQLTLAVERLEEVAHSTSYIGDAARDNDALALAYAGRTGPLHLQLEGRHDRNSVYGSVDTGRLGARWPLTPSLALRALVGNSFRAPSFNDLVFPGYGVPTLRPERARSAELGAEATWGPVDATLTAYRQDLRDLIAYEADRSFCPPDASYDFGCARNVNRARLQGATLGLGANGTAWRLRATLDWLDAKDRASGARLPRRAAAQQSLVLGWREGALDLGAELLHVGSRMDSGAVLRAETTVDLQASWRLARSLVLQTKLVNATGEDRQPLRDYQDLGRQAWLVLRWEGTL